MRSDEKLLPLARADDAGIALRTALRADQPPCNRLSRRADGERRQSARAIVLDEIRYGDPNGDRLRQWLIRSAAHEMNLDPPRRQLERRSVLFNLHTGHPRERHIAE